MRRHVLPFTDRELEALIADGYLEPIEQPTKLDPTRPEDKFSATLIMSIDRIRTHTLRMELAKTPDLVIRMFTAHLSNNFGRTVGFSVNPENVNQPDPELAVTFSAPWQKMLEVAKLGPAQIGEATDKIVREALAYRILACLTTRHPLAKDQPAAIIRKYWTPSEAFLRSYSRAQLMIMVEQLNPGENVSALKRDGLAEIVAYLATQNKAWLPLAF